MTRDRHRIAPDPRRDPRAPADVRQARRLRRPPPFARNDRERGKQHHRRSGSWRRRYERGPTASLHRRRARRAPLPRWKDAETVHQWSAISTARSSPGANKTNSGLLHKISARTQYHCQNQGLQVRRIRRPTALPPSHPSPDLAATEADAATHRDGKDADCFFDLAQTKSPERQNSERLSEGEGFESLRAHGRRTARAVAADMTFFVYARFNPPRRPQRLDRVPARRSA